MVKEMKLMGNNIKMINSSPKGLYAINSNSIYEVIKW